jgi:hypothetical protein
MRLLDSLVSQRILAGLYGFCRGFVIVPLVYHLFPKFGLLTQPDQHFAMNLQPDLRVAFVKA